MRLAIRQRIEVGETLLSYARDKRLQANDVDRPVAMVEVEGGWNPPDCRENAACMAASAITRACRHTPACHHFAARRKRLDLSFVSQFANGLDNFLLIEAINPRANASAGCEGFACPNARSHLLSASLYRKQLAARFEAWRLFAGIAQAPSTVF
ncbi:hypothetical protein OKW30_002375 [Paraburkholderia sp. Clong3]